MVIRIHDKLTTEDLAIAGQSALAPALEASPPQCWPEAWIVADPPAWDGGLWNSEIRSVTVHLYNAGATNATLTAIQVEGDWLSPVKLTEPLRLPGFSGPIPLSVPLRAEGLHPGLLTGSIAIIGPKLDLEVPLRLQLPKGANPWWQNPVLTLSTRVEEQSVIVTAPIKERPRKLNMDLRFMDQPVSAEPPEANSHQIIWRLNLLTGEYQCTLRVDMKSVELQVNEPHRWSWERAGVGRLVVGSKLVRTRLHNIGDQPVELQLEADAPWLEIWPEEVRLEPSGSVEITIADRLTDLDDAEGMANLRVLALPNRQLWATLPVRRSLTASMALPVVQPRGLLVRIWGNQVEEGELSIRNAGGVPVTIELEPSGAITAELERSQPIIAPGETRYVRIAPVSEVTGLATVGFGELLLRTDALHPALREIHVPVKVERLELQLTPDAIDAGDVPINSSRYHSLKVSRSDRKLPSPVVTIPQEARHWLSYRPDEFTIQNRSQLSGPVRADVRILDTSSNLECILPVMAFLMRPRIRYQERLEVNTPTSRRLLRKLIKVWDEGEGLQLRTVWSSDRFLDVIMGPDGVEVTIRPRKRPGRFTATVEIRSNDPQHPVVQVPVIINVRPTLWDRLKAYLEQTWLFWVVGILTLLAALLLGWAVVQLWRPHSQPPVAPLSAPRGGDSYPRLDRPQ